MEQTIDIIIINLSSISLRAEAFYFSEKILFWRQYFSFHDITTDRKEFGYPAVVSFYEIIHNLIKS